MRGGGLGLLGLLLALLVLAMVVKKQMAPSPVVLAPQATPQQQVQQVQQALDAALQTPRSEPKE